MKSRSYKALPSCKLYTLAQANSTNFTTFGLLLPYVCF
ncbi:hypothetical protein PVAP13_1NG422100 [Panicum virgatum]|uniref:Uncharacterized protein n=1 Tax=Panicum virgatum TaxID=38727 RepID=A0A8T0X6P9_PANVG|nr:hypothetical protein PVAP13_1NG422100 [Panicum virgatum]